MPELHFVIFHGVVGLLVVAIGIVAIASTARHFGLGMTLLGIGIVASGCAAYLMHVGPSRHAQWFGVGLFTAACAAAAVGLGLILLSIGRRLLGRQRK